MARSQPVGRAEAESSPGEARSARVGRVLTASRAERFATRAMNPDSRNKGPCDRRPTCHISFHGDGDDSPLAPPAPRTVGSDQSLQNVESICSLVDVAYQWCERPPPEGGGFGLRLKAGLSRPQGPTRERTRRL